MQERKDFLMAASNRDADQVMRDLNQYGSPLAKVNGKLPYSIEGFISQGNALHYAIIGPVGVEQVMDERILTIVSGLLKLDCNVNEQNGSKDTPLHCLCKETDIDLEIVKYRVSSSQDMTQVIKQKIEANKIYKLKIAEMLLQAGAKPTIPNGQAILPIDLIKEGEFHARMDELFKKYHPQYVAEGQTAVQEYRLQREVMRAFQERNPHHLRTAIQSGANPDMSVSGHTLLALSVIQGNSEAFEVLLEFNADPAKKSIMGGVEVDPFDLILIQFSPPIFKALLQRGFDPNRALCPNDELNFAAHFTTVHWHSFALAGNVEAIQILLEGGYELERDTKMNNRTIIDLLQNNALKNDPFLLESKTDQERRLSGMALAYEVIKIMDQFSLPIGEELTEVPPQIQPLIEGLQSKGFPVEEATQQFYDLVKDPSYKERSRYCRQMFAQIEAMNSNYQGDFAKHRQILNLLNLHDSYGYAGRLYFSFFK